MLWPLIKTVAHHYCTMATHKVCRLLLLSHGHSHRLQLTIIILRPFINSADHHYYLMAISKVCSSSLLYYGHSQSLQIIIIISWPLPQTAAIIIILRPVINIQNIIIFWKKIPDQNKTKDSQFCSFWNMFWRLVSNSIWKNFVSDLLKTPTRIYGEETARYTLHSIRSIRSEL